MREKLLERDEGARHEANGQHDELESMQRPRRFYQIQAGRPGCEMAAITHDTTTTPENRNMNLTDPCPENVTKHVDHMVKREIWTDWRERPGC